ncbi:hypothetical protein P6709_20270, partial [Jeotgalibacillus sp. ET6]|uniref:hypothetical protein n=1 Tax=Jeotgalibacillus sp. ET6 TaxID=3037260 RepID=UPI0024186DB9
KQVKRRRRHHVSMKFVTGGNSRSIFFYLERLILKQTALPDGKPLQSLISVQLASFPIFETAAIPQCVWEISEDKH